MKRPFLTACWSLLGLVLSFAGAATAVAESASSAKSAAPQAVVERVTDDMMALIRGGEKALKENPEAYYANVRKTLEPVVSFDFIARNVMAAHWDSASAEQRSTFTETFTRSMVETLGKGLANFSDFNIKTLPVADVGDARRVEVVQEVATNDGTNRVSYTMALNRDGEWKLINVVLNGVNLGRSFRDQFAQSMRQNGNDLDKVIAGWAQTG